MGKRLIKVGMVLCLGAVGFSSYKIADKLLEYRRGDSTYRALEANVRTDGDLDVAEIPLHVRSGDASGADREDGAGGTAGAVGTQDASGAEGRDSSAESAVRDNNPGLAGADGPQDKVTSLPGAASQAVKEGGSSGGNASQPEVILQVRLPEVDFDALLAENPDTAGWLICEDTRINYPVVQGKDNEEYLHRMFNGEYNYAGSLFMESLNDRKMTDANTIIYGHHMRDGSMFHDLVKFQEKDFSEAHPVMLFLTPEMNYVAEIFSAFVASPEDNCWPVSFADEKEWEEWVQMLASRSDFPAPFIPQPQDRLITLSTCSYEFENARYVVYGALSEIPREARESAPQEP